MKFGIVPKFLALVLVAAACATGCGSGQDGGRAAQGRQVFVADASGREVAVPADPMRVVTLNKNAAEVMRLLGVADRIKGVSDWIPRNPGYWPELSGAVNVGRFTDPDAEAIAALKPDLVLCYQSSPGPGFEEKMAAIGAKVLRLELHRIGSLPRDVEAMGRIFGREDKAREYLDWLQARMDELARVVAADPARPAAYLEAYADFAACGRSSSMNERIAFAGGRNIGEALVPNASPVPPDWILEQRPEVVVKMCSVHNAYALEGPGGMADQRRDMLARTGWDRMPAGRRGAVFLMTTDVTSGPASVVGLAWMVRWLHPERARALDPKAWHREYMERFQGRPWQGVFVHPEAAEAPGGGGL